MTTVNLPIATEKVTILDVKDYSWTWNEARGLFERESGGEFLSFDDLMDTLGPLMIGFDPVTAADILP